MKSLVDTIIKETGAADLTATPSAQLLAGSRTNHRVKISPPKKPEARKEVSIALEIRALCFSSSGSWSYCPPVMSWQPRVISSMVSATEEECECSAFMLVTPICYRTE